MDLTSALLAAVAGLTTALGLMWSALASKIHAAEKACEEDRRILRAMVEKVNQLDRRPPLTMP